MDDPGFWWELIGKTGAPIFAATLVAALLAPEPRLLHAALMATGFGMMGLCHWRTHHRPGRAGASAPPP